jgi:beta-galactosidase
MSNWTKGVVWVNGHNLGRYWEIGPQHRLYCPASWLRRGHNEIIIFDHHQIEAKPIAFAGTLG